MKYLKKHLSLALALVLCLSLAACGKSSEDYVESNEDYGDDGSDYNLYGVPDSFEGLVKDSEQMANLYLYGGAWTGEDGGTLVAANNDEGDEVRFALYDADEDMTAFTQVTGDAPGENIGDGDYGFFAGVWYQDGDPGAASIIEFDASGSWELLERPGDDGDPTMVDCGTIEVDQDGAGQYFAISTIHTDVVYDFTLVGGDVIYWGGEYDYYQKIE